MASLTIFGLILCVFVVSIRSNDLQVGSNLNAQLIYMDTVKLSSIPFTTRTKNVFYTNSTNPRVIKGITAIDLDRSKGKATITAGGVGSTFANIKLKSEKGDGLNYQIQVFA